MAIAKQIEILKQGPDVWNRWRKENSDVVIDLSETALSADELRNANLAGANLKLSGLMGHLRGTLWLVDANLRNANLSHSDFGNPLSVPSSGAVSSPTRTACFTNADLSGCLMDCTSLQNADLRGANLSNSVLYRTNFHGADLSESDLTGARLSDAILTRANLSGAIGLEKCSHAGPSSLDMQTLMVSGKLPESFLRGCGLPQTLIDYLPSLLNEAIRFCSCFISYSSRDQDFANKLHSDLQNKGVRCWFAPHDLPIGAKTWDAIDEAIQYRDKLLLILSQNSIASDWVEDEVSKTYAEERRRKDTVLFPVCIDDTVFDSAEPWVSKLRDQRNIGDFTKWKERDAYVRTFDRVVRDLQANRTGI